MRSMLSAHAFAISVSLSAMAQQTVAIVSEALSLPPLPRSGTIVARGESTA